MIDASGRWNLPTALHIGRHFADYEVYGVKLTACRRDLSAHLADLPAAYVGGRWAANDPCYIFFGNYPVG